MLSKFKELFIPNRFSHIELKPIIKIDDNAKQFTLEVNVERFDPEDVFVRTSDNEIMIKAARCEIKENSQICQWSWTMQPLPFGLTSNDLKQSFKDGILTVTNAKDPLP